MLAKDIVNIMNKLAPTYLIDKSWDNSGLQLGSLNKKIKSIIVSLDVTPNVVLEAINRNTDMIITHHPFFFNPIRKVTPDDIRGKMTYDIIKNDIVIFSAHTNLDSCNNSVSQILAQELGLDNLIVLSEAAYDVYPLENATNKYGYGRIGDFPRELYLEELAVFTKEKLKCDTVRVYGDKYKMVKKIAICSGSGGDFIRVACENKADVFITGDIKYHDAQLAMELDMPIIDANHYDTEKVILPYLKNYLENNLRNKADIFIFQESGAPFSTI